MKVHFINILLFALPLNILVNTHKKNTFITPRHTQINRSLCECELYSPANYYNDPEMKSVIQQFEDRTTQRFHEYDERMKTTRQKCKDKCDKQIEKIILKDKLEKQMEQQLITLETKIDTNDIPTCVCEKSIAYKVEKGCLRCGGILGTAMPGLGAIGGSLLNALYAWKPEALKAAIVAAEKAGAIAGEAAGDAAGAAEVIQLVNSEFGVKNIGGKALETVFTAQNYTLSPQITESVYSQYLATCTKSVDSPDSLLCFFGSSSSSSQGKALLAHKSIGAKVKSIVTQAEGAASKAAEATRETVTTELTAEKTGVINTIFMSKQTAIIASIVTIVVIVLIMVIIYLILRYRRKKKLKKKLQYIKLLEE
ncbi:rifin PIR protein, putative [Plasmodium reichenowi]|uniref:Rifin PIR protein, putative n=1 Tax=Plasmodium reichenowi TaxID=5854 RepID=A0A2P9DSW9_PLARE|nr:rifin PIR protein, putative [Plasmodium reichenowi]